MDTSGKDGVENVCQVYKNTIKSILEDIVITEERRYCDYRGSKTQSIRMDTKKD